MYLKPLHLPKARVLVLEEATELRAGLCELLTDAGYGLAGGADGAGAAGRIDLVLAGLDARHTPKAALRLLACTAPLILLVDRAAWAGFDFFDAANDLGAVAALRRPFARSALLRLVAKLLSERAVGSVPVEDGDEHLPGLAELLLRLENTNLI